MRGRTMRWLGATLFSVLPLQACGPAGSEQAAVRSRELVLEGEVREVLDADGSRVGGPTADDRGILVVSLERGRLRVRDRVRVVGEQRILRVREIEEVFDLDLDDVRYRPFEGEDVIVARVVTVLPTR